MKVPTKVRARASRPTGKRITWTNNDVARVRDGVIVELWGGPDMFSIMTQLGAIPPAGGDELDTGVSNRGQAPSGRDGS